MVLFFLTALLSKEIQLTFDSLFLQTPNNGGKKVLPTYCNIKIANMAETDFCICVCPSMTIPNFVILELEFLVAGMVLLLLSPHKAIFIALIETWEKKS